MSEIYFIKSVDNSRWVPATGSREPRRYLLGLLLSTTLLGGGLFAARERLMSRENGYRLEQLDHQKQELIEANRKLRLEDASLGDPSRIDWIARNQLGMTTLGPNQIFRGQEPAGPVVAQGPEAEPAPSSPQDSSLAAALH